MSDSAWITIPEEARLDIQWFLQYASLGNGVYLISPDSDYLHIECDACLSGAGAISVSSYYKWKFSKLHLEKYRSIHMLEAINVLVSY